nr:hypothetical protein [Tanacetum cinerariifolium]
MSSPPDFQANNNMSIVNAGDDAQWAPPPEFEGRKNTSYTSYSQQQRTIQGMIEEGLGIISRIRRPEKYGLHVYSQQQCTIQDMIEEVVA